MKAVVSFLKTTVIITVCMALNACMTSNQSQALTPANGSMAQATMPANPTGNCDVIASVVVIGKTSFFGDSYFGDGVVVGDGRHVIATPLTEDFALGESYSVTSLKCEDGKIAYGTKAKATVVSSDTISGVAALRFETNARAGRPMAISAETVIIGDKVNLIGRTSKFASKVVSSPMFKGDSVYATFVAPNAISEKQLSDPNARSEMIVMNDAVVATNESGQVVGIVTGFGKNGRGESRCRIAPIAALTASLKN